MSARKFSIFYFLIVSFAYGAPKDYQKIVKLKETIEGEKLFAQGKYDEALTSFHDAIDKGEERGEPWFYIGSVYELRHEYAQSIPYFEEAVKRELPREFREATLWKLILLHRKEENYADVITYIDMLEEMGVSHPNLDKYREEAEISLSPEKIEARLRFKEGKEIIINWEKDNPDEKFWEGAPQKDKLAVLEKYEKASSMDEKLRYLNWEIARHYDKMNMLSEEARIYEIIISYSDSDEAYYRRGVVAKKEGDYIKARESFQSALSNLKSENLKFFILINLAQVLYATSEYSLGMEKAKEAIQASQFKSDPMAPGKLLYCLHAANVEETGESDTKECSLSVKESELKKKDPRALSLYYFTKGEVLRKEYLKNTKPETEKLALKYYTDALIPPELRQVSIKSLELKPLSDYDSASWSVPAEWLYSGISHGIEFFKNEARYKYIFLKLYSGAMSRSLGDGYSKELAQACYENEKYDEAFDILKKIHARSVDEEIIFLNIYLQKQNYNEFQKEAVSYSEHNPSLSESLKTQIESKNLIRYLPPKKMTEEFKKHFNIKDETEETPAPQTEPAEEKAVESP